MGGGSAGWGGAARGAHSCIPPPGPSVTLDSACSSSLLALHNAYQAIRSGECPAAVVGGINLLLKPNTSVQFMKLGMLSPEGACKSFDDAGGGRGGQGWGVLEPGPLASTAKASSLQGTATAAPRPWWPSC